jgi:hypothetical protein
MGSSYSFGDKLTVILDPQDQYTEVEDRRLIEALGYIPEMALDDRYQGLTFWDALDKAYAHGGGLVPFNSFSQENFPTLEYEGDPPIHPVALYYRTMEDGTTEKAYQYEHAWVAIERGTAFTVARMD